MAHIFRPEDDEDDDYIVDDQGLAAYDREVIRAREPGRITTSHWNRYTGPARSYGKDQNLAVRLRRDVSRDVRTAGRSRIGGADARTDARGAGPSHIGGADAHTDARGAVPNRFGGADAHTDARGVVPNRFGGERSPPRRHWMDPLDSECTRRRHQPQ